MRPVLYSDLCAASRALMAVVQHERHRLCAQMLHEADTADRFVRRLGKLHPKFGGGTLAEVASQRPMAADQGFDDLDYCSCVKLLLQHLIERRSAAPVQSGLT